MPYLHLLLILAIAPGEGQGLLSPTEAVRELAVRDGLSLVMRELPEGRTIASPLADTPTVLAELRAAGVDVGVWRGILVARPDAGGTLEERIRGALTEHERDLLLRPPDTGHEWEPGWEQYVVGLAARMLRGDTSRETYDLACDTALWLAAPEVSKALRWDDAIRGGRAILYMDREEDKPWVWGIVLRDEARDPLPLLFTRSPMLQAELGEDEPATDSGPPVSLESEGASGAEVCQQLSAAGRPVTWALDTPDLLTVRLAGIPLRDALAAVAAVCGGAPAFADAQCGIVPPRVARERIVARVSLPVWSTALLTNAEQSAERGRRHQVLCDALSAERKAALRRGLTRLRDLEPVEKACFEYWLEMAVGRRIAVLLACLPEHDGPVPFWLRRSPTLLFASVSLENPVRGETMGQGAYLRVLEEAGEPIPDWPLPSRLPEGQ